LRAFSRGQRPGAQTAELASDVFSDVRSKSICPV
jgi:hypothetical protein